MIVAIDGPAGAGKSTISLALAEALGCVRLDTGALYRVVAYAALGAGIAEEDRGLEAFVSELDIRYEPSGIWLDGTEVSDHLRTPEISSAASSYSAQPAVRRALLGLQRRLGTAQNAVVDGRDIGTVVFPDADAKIFLTAAAEARAHRRLLELREQSVESTFDEVYQAIVDRDHADMNRAVAPLKQAEDAVVVDATELSIAQVVQRCLEVVRTATGPKA